MITTIPAEPRAEQIAINLPYPPSVNSLWRRVGNRTVLSRKGREYFEVVADAAWEFDRRAWPLTGRLRVALTLFPPDRRRRDIDNACKAVLDALGKIGLYEDDSQIDRLEVTRADLGGLVHVTVEEIA